jgi:hypothetical protein
VAVSNVIQVIDHPTAPVFAGDYRGARISVGPSRKAMIVAVAAILAVDTAAISIWAAVSARPAPASGSGIVPGQEAGSSVPVAPWVTDGNGASDMLTRGDRIRYAFYVDNSTGKVISANVRFEGTGTSERSVLRAADQTSSERCGRWPGFGGDGAEFSCQPPRAYRL